MASQDLLQQSSTSLQQQPPISQPSNTKTYLDEFKHGFPSNGLSSISNKWWGNHENDSGKQNAEESKEKEESEDEEPVKLSKDTERLENINEEQSNGCNGLSSNGTMMLSSLRKRAAEEGRIVKVGIGRLCRQCKVSGQHEALLMKLFGSSFLTERQ